MHEKEEGSRLKLDKYLSSVFPHGLYDDKVALLISKTSMISAFHCCYPSGRLRTIIVGIEQNKTVYDLAKNIQDDLSQRFKIDISLDDLQLFKEADLPKEPENDAKKRVLDWLSVHEKEESSRLKSDANLSFAFPHGPTPGMWHIIISSTITAENEDEEEGDEGNDKVTELISIAHKAYQRVINKVLTSPSHSKSSKSGGYLTFQQGNNPIYDGRYNVDHPVDTRAPPIQLYHPVFGHFWDDYTNKDLVVPRKVARATASLMGKVSGIYDTEASRREAIRPLLEDVIGVRIAAFVDMDSTSPDGGTTAPSVGDVAAILVEEERREFGDRGSDPATQAGLSYARFWAQSNRAAIRENSCCPAFLIGTAGASLAILGAVWTDKIIVQRLTDYIWLGHDAIFNHEAIFRNAHLFYALNRSLRKLETFYQTLTVHSQPAIPKKLEPRYFPSTNAYRAPDNTLVNFTYIIPLEPDSICTTFLAKTDGPASENIVVKFVCHYNKEAHMLLAEKNMAPKLRYCDKVGVRDGDPSYGNLHMVVMDFVDGETMDQAETIPATCSEKIRNILAVLHDAGYVFGDLRKPNVMITKNDEVMFIDFDMVGKHGQSEYPLLMSPIITWAEGVEEGIMMKEHDLFMFGKLFE